MKPFAERDPRIVALIGFAVLAALLVGVVNIKKAPFIGEGELHQAEFTDASGLKVGDPVTIAGIKVGTVDDIELERGHVVVSFHVKDAELPSATRGSIEIKTLLGQHHLALQPAGSGTLEPGSRIPRSRTTTPLDIVPALQQATQTLDDIDTQQLASAMDVLSEVLSKSAPEVRGTLRGLSRLSQTISSRDTQLKRLLRHTRAVTGTFASRNHEVSELIDSAGVVLSTLHDRRAAIRALLRGTSDLAAQLTGLVRDNRAELGPTLDKLNEVLTVLKRNDRNLGKALTQVTLYARTFTNVIGTGPWIDSIIKVPRGFALCSGGRHNAVAELLEPVLSDVNRRVTGSGKPCLPLGASTDTRGGPK